MLLCGSLPVRHLQVDLVHVDPFCRGSSFLERFVADQGKEVEVEVFCDCDAKWTVATRVRLALMVQVRRCLEPLFFAT